MFFFFFGANHAGVCKNRSLLVCHCGEQHLFPQLLGAVIAVAVVAVVVVVVVVAVISVVMVFVGGVMVVVVAVNTVVLCFFSQHR